MSVTSPKTYNNRIDFGVVDVNGFVFAMSRVVVGGGYTLGSVLKGFLFLGFVLLKRKNVFRVT